MSGKPVLDEDAVGEALKAVRALSVLRRDLASEAAKGGLRNPLKSMMMRDLKEADQILRDADDLGDLICEVDFHAGRAFQLFFARGKKYDIIGRQLDVSRRTAIRYTARAREILIRDTELNAVLASLAERTERVRAKVNR